jgi:hypothetical protein
MYTCDRSNSQLSSLDVEFEKETTYPINSSKAPSLPSEEEECKSELGEKFVDDDNNNENGGKNF